MKTFLRANQVQSRKSTKQIERASRPVIEALESRCLLSVTPGLPDTTYNTTGVNALTTIPNFYYGTFLAVATQTDGKSVAAGYIQQTNTTTGNDLLVARFNKDGTLDTSFGGSNTGYKITDIGSQNQTSTNMKIQADGKILVLTSSGLLVQNLANSWIIRFKADGTVDTAFGGNNTGYIASNDTFSAIALQGDGSILAAGSTSTTTVADAFVERYSSAGVLDSNFGTGGRATKEVGNNATTDDAFIYSIVQDSSGRILLGGTRGNLNVPNNTATDGLVVRFTKGGTLDTNFGSGNGFVSANALNQDFFQTISLLPGGDIELAGNANVSTNTRNVAILEFNDSGTLIHTFLPTVYGTTTSGTESNNNTALIQSDGKIVGETGVFGTTTDSQSFIYRLTSAGTLDANYGNGGKYDVATNQLIVLESASLQADGAMIAAGAQLAANGSTYYPVIARYTGDATGTTAGNISGNVFYDANGNAAKNAAETNLAGVDVYLDIDGNGSRGATEPETVTDANGNYAFSNLTPATYTVRAEAPAGYTQTLPANGGGVPVTLGASQSATAGEIGFNLTPVANASITGEVYNDADNSGTLNAGDAALPGITVTLTGAGQTQQTTTTNANGIYNFTGLAAGVYTVSESIKAGYTQTQPATSTYTATLAAGQSLTSENFGQFKAVIAPSIAINDVVQNEGNNGTTSFTFTVTRSGDTSGSSTVSYKTQDDTAASPGDYTAIPATTLSFAANETTKTVTVFVNGDTTFEANETFDVVLSNPSNATISDGTGVGTITNDDAAPVAASVSIDDVTHNEGDRGTTAYVFTVTRAGDPSTYFSVDYATADGTATAADGDYTAASGTLNFAAGDLTQTITVLVNGDTKVEADEAFTVNLSNFSVVQPAIRAAAAPLVTPSPITRATGTGTIVNDDATVVLPTLAIDSVSHNEGNAGTTNYIFTVTRGGDTSTASTVAYATVDGTATVADDDYIAASGTLTFAAGAKTQTITVKVNGDTTYEGDEAFTVNLSSPTNATVSTATGTGTIVNDDAEPSISINNVAMKEGDTGTTSFVFTVTRSGDASVPFTVDYATADGTATVADGDYQAISGTLSFAAGDKTKTITVFINGDTKVEADETFTVNLSNLVYTSGGAVGTVYKAIGTGTIQNDDTAAVLPTLSVNDVSKSEGNAGTTAFTFTVTRTGNTTGASTVHWATADGTATAPGDYTVASGDLSFVAGQKTATFTVFGNGDTTIESNEQFLVNLTNATGATIKDGQGIGTIKNDDAAKPATHSQPYILIDNPRVKEGNNGLTAMTFTLTLTHTSNRMVTVHFKTTNGQLGDSKHDYVAKTGTVTFKPGQRTATVTIFIRGNTFKESNEKFNLDLFSATNAGIGDRRGTGTIVNDD